MRSSIAAVRCAGAHRARYDCRSASIAAAFVAVRSSFALDDLDTQIDGLDTTIAGDLQLVALRLGSESAAVAHRLVRRQCRSLGGLAASSSASATASTRSSETLDCGRAEHGAQRTARRRRELERSGRARRDRGAARGLDADRQRRRYRARRRAHAASPSPASPRLTSPADEILGLDQLLAGVRADSRVTDYRSAGARPLARQDRRTPATPRRRHRWRDGAERGGGRRPGSTAQRSRSSASAWPCMSIAALRPDAVEAASVAASMLERSGAG